MNDTFIGPLSEGHLTSVSDANNVALNLMVAMACGRRVQLLTGIRDGRGIVLNDPDAYAEQNAGHMAYLWWEPTCDISHLRRACEIAGRDFLSYFGGIDREKWRWGRCEEYTKACRDFVTDVLGEEVYLPLPNELFN